MADCEAQEGKSEARYYVSMSLFAT